MATYFQILAILAVIAMVFGQVSLVAAQTPDPWVPFCSGSGALVIQETTNTGDGVAMSAADAVENWQCGDASVLVGYVEPWDGNGDRDRTNFPDKFNADSMVVGTPAQLLNFVEKTGLDNGSWWIVDPNYAEHPLVVFASEATNADNLGLNPMENQIDLDRMGWVRGRVDDLYGVQKYVDDYLSTDLLAQRIVQLGWASEKAQVSTEVPTMVPTEQPTLEPTEKSVEQSSATPTPFVAVGSSNVASATPPNYWPFVWAAALIALAIIGASLLNRRTNNPVVQKPTTPPPAKPTSK